MIHRLERLSTDYQDARAFDRADASLINFSNLA